MDRTHSPPPKRIKTVDPVGVCNRSDVVKLNVGGVVFQTSLSTLTAKPGTMLERMFNAGLAPSVLDADGCYFIDRDGKAFAHILQFLRTAELPDDSLPRAERKVLRVEASFYGIEELEKWACKELDNGNPSVAEIFQTFLVKSGAENQELDLKAANFDGLDLSFWAHPHPVVAKYATFRNANLMGTRLFGGDCDNPTRKHEHGNGEHEKAIINSFESVCFNQACLAKAKMEYTSFSKAEFQHAKLNGGFFSYSRFDRSSMQHSDLSYANLEECSFYYAELAGACLKYANMKKANLRFAKAHGVNMCQAKLYGASFVEAHLDGADFRGADLREADFDDAKLQGTRFQCADLREACLHYCLSFGSSDWYDDVPPDKEILADFSNANLEGASFKEVHDDDPDFTCELAMERVLFAEANLKGVVMKQASFKKVDFSKANLYQVDFSDSTFDACVFTNANLAGANFSDCTFTGCSFVRADLNGASFQCAKFKGLMNCLSGANSQNTDLRDVDWGATRLINRL